MNIVEEFISKFKDLFKRSSTESSPPEKTVPVDEVRLMSDDEKLDERLEETFPASDPPGHILKSEEDLRQY